MSRILLAWELGTGAGHLALLRPVAEALVSRGHRLTLATRDIGSAALIFSGMENEMHIVQSPACHNVYGGLADPPLNFAEILMRFGYLDVPMLKALLLGWRSLLEMSGAERLIVDHAPTALLAARGMPVACSTFGNPFSVPPPVSPTPNMRDWMDVPPQRLQDSDSRVVSTINAALAPDAPPVSSLPQMFEIADHLFVGMPELDPYGRRESANYIGLLTGRSGSKPAVWPDGAGPRVFAYLRTNYPHLQRCLEALAAAPVRCLVNLSGATPQLTERYRSPRLSFSTGHVDIDHVLAQCDALICQSGLGTVSAALRGGKPMLLLPAQLEQFLLARNVEKLGVGITIHPETPAPDFSGALMRVVSEPVFADNARALAQRCSAPSVATIVEQVVARIEARSTAPVA